MAEFKILGKDPLTWWRCTVRSRGVLHALRVAWFTTLDTWYDYRHGIDTIRRIHPGRIPTDSPNRAHSSHYGATRALPFFGLLQRLNLPKDVTFVDLGSGKGRVLLLAADWGFRKVVGIEFSKALCALARQNLEAFRRRKKIAAQIEIIESDVTHYSFRNDDCVLFLFDPFSALILERVLDNFRESIRRDPRAAWMIYNTPVEHDTVERSGLFPTWQRDMVRGTEFMVYRRDPGDPLP